MNISNQPLRVLFVCTGNAGRSQLAQALGMLQNNESISFESAGVQPWKALHPMAIKLMRELGIDDKTHFPKAVTALADRNFDVVITIGDPARRLLPLRINGNPHRIHWDINDPADADGTAASETVFRATLAQIEHRFSQLWNQLKQIYPPSLLRDQPGINSGLWHDEILNESHLALAAEGGFEAMEISPYRSREHFDVRDTKHVQEIRRAADNAGLAIWSLHSRDEGDLTSPDAAVRQKQMDELFWCLDAADTLGATVVVSHIQVLGKHFSDLPAAEARLSDSMNELSLRAEDSAVRFGLENGYACKEGQWARDMFRRAAAFSPAAFGYVIDTGHANMAGDLEDIETGVGQRLISLHLNDNCGKYDSHLPGGEGTVDWARIARLLRATQYQGCLMWEIAASAERSSSELLADTMKGHQRLMEFL